jgi:REP element-mobilizing transposase RayT
MIHSVWATKNRLPIIHEKIQQILLNHIKEKSIDNEIFIDTHNCVEDHYHVLFSLGLQQTIAKVHQLIKGESSNWMNKQKLIKQKFEWQDDYFAASVSELNLHKVRNYIRNQKEHHRKITFAEEYEGFIKAHGLKWNL